MNIKKLAELQQYIESADLALQQAREILAEEMNGDFPKRIAKNKAKNLALENEEGDAGEKIIEGVFDGQNMISSDGKQYSVPANYASKSKLVEGDVLKLTIQEDGSFLYKQIKPIERKRLTGDLLIDEVSGQYAVLIPGGKKYNVLTASVTYFKGEIGDEVTILVPRENDSCSAAIENIVKRETDKKFEKPLDVDKSTEQDIDHQTDSEEREEYLDNQSITQHVKDDSVLPDIDDLGREEDEKDDQKTYQLGGDLESLIGKKNSKDGTSDDYAEL